MQKNCQRPCSVSRKVRQKGFRATDTSNGSELLALLIETFRLKDEDNYEHEIWIKVDTRILKIIDSPESFISPFFTRKVSTVTFSEGGYTLSRSQNDKTSNIW